MQNTYAHTNTSGLSYAFLNSKFKKTGEYLGNNTGNVAEFWEDLSGHTKQIQPETLGRTPKNAIKVCLSLSETLPMDN